MAKGDAGATRLSRSTQKCTGSSLGSGRDAGQERTNQRFGADLSGQRARIESPSLTLRVFCEGGVFFPFFFPLFTDFPREQFFDLDEKTKRSGMFRGLITASGGAIWCGLIEFKGAAESMSRPE